MMTNKDDIIRLLNRISSGEATDAEIQAYNRWINAFQLKGQPTPDVEKIRMDMLSEIKKQIHRRGRRHRLRLWTKIAAAASVFLMLSAGGYHFLYRQGGKQIVQSEKRQIVLASNNAVLTLANGQTIVLEDAHNGKLTRQGSCQVIKADSGLLVYQCEKITPGNATQTDQGAMAFNTLTTERGGQYRLILPDGTKVWLNAISSIRYPAAFTGTERRVAITGEAYLEVAKNARHPFIVTTRHSDITVLGTRFNVMAYDNEPAVTTTLLEGSVKVSVPGEQTSTILSPGQQANVGNASGNISVKEVDAAGVAAWIHGLLSLKGCSVREFMNQLSRRYDVDVEYTGTVPEQRFGGVINRSAPLADVLAALEADGIHTRLQGRKIIVLSR